jgi:DNA-binding NarL/FixJ family response regulator
MKKNLITVLIADDTQIAREGLKSIFQTADDLHVVGEAEEAYTVVEKVQKYSPDILIMDLKWGDDETAGWSTIRDVKKKFPEIKIVAITAYGNLIADARKNGADEVITKQFHREEFINLIRDVAAREKAAQIEIPIAIQKPEPLTEREQEVLRLLDKGVSDKEISLALHIKVNTAKNHVKNILQKMNVENRRKAVIRARELGIIT